MNPFTRVLRSSFAVLLSAISVSAFANEPVFSRVAAGNFIVLFHFEPTAVALGATERERLHGLVRRADYLSSQGVSCEVVKINFGVETNINPKALYASRKALALLRLDYLKQLAGKLQFPKDFVFAYDHDKEAKVSGVILTENPDTIGMVATFLPGGNLPGDIRPNYCTELRLK